MAKVLVLYYSMYGHIETMAHAVAEGANRVDGVEVIVKRVPETMQAEDFPKPAGKHKTRQSPPRRNWLITTPSSLVPPPALAICPVRCAPSSIRLAGCGPPAPVRQTRQRIQLNRNRRRSGTNHYLNLDYACPPRDGDCAYRLRAQELFDVSQVRGGTPYGATTIAGGDGSRQPSRKS
jgi:NAD(P)H dehydrogenase (quinone)